MTKGHKSAGALPSFLCMDGSFNSNIGSLYQNKHQVAFNKLQHCAENVTYTLPSDSQHVQYLLDGIRTSNGQLQAAIANVLANDDPTGKLHNFEGVAAYIVPHDPVALKRPGNKREQYEIAAVDL